MEVLTIMSSAFFPPTALMYRSTIVSADCAFALAARCTHATTRASAVRVMGPILWPDLEGGSCFLDPPTGYAEAMSSPAPPENSALLERLRDTIELLESIAAD